MSPLRTRECTLEILAEELRTPNAQLAAYRIEKAGFYLTHSPYSAQFQPQNGRWQPWNPTIAVVLNRIRNPTPMYAKKITSRLPQLDRPFSYDLEVGDWLEPHGKGKTADFIFVAHIRQSGEHDFDYELNLRFSNPGDGIQRFDPGAGHAGSVLRSPYDAPAEGYVSKWQLLRSRRPNSREQSSFMDQGGYFFRVRPRLEPNGRVAKACYGKIYGDFFDMIYYFNPDGTRNVEFDPKRNLFGPKSDRDSAFWGLGP